MTDWDRFNSWHTLFDALCDEAGYYDDAALASAYCSVTESKGQKQFEATVRNLNNWRAGRHVPRTANLRVLARILKIEDDPQLARRWRDLHKQAKAAEPITGATPADVTISGEILPAVAGAATRHIAHPQTLTTYRVVNDTKRWSNLQALIGGLALIIVGAVGGSALTASGWRPWAGPADGTPIIPFKPDVRFRVGESRPIYAFRGDCKRLPPPWGVIASTLPDPRLGKLSDGGLAQRNSKFCQGLTPAQAIVFTADRPGVEEFEIQGDFFKMTVEQ